MTKTIFTLIGKRNLTPDICELRLLGDTSAFTAPGQFLNIELEGLFLRRPISVCDCEGDCLTVIVRDVGEGTRALCRASIGTRFDALTGLGNGFDTAVHGKKTILIGGGVGTPPLYLLAKRLLQRGVSLCIALGFSCSSDAFYIDEFSALGCPVLVSTVDGSLGEKGFVTALAESTDCDYAMCCGPEAMLRAVYNLPQLTDGQFCFEERMGCGFGACMGCTCATKYGSKRICRDGPVLKREEIVW
ncbi:MAG: dihydroorotate dehydrogenase electron transfer subunit [Oscillospiraceae bacterium]